MMLLDAEHEDICIDDQGRSAHCHAEEKSFPEKENVLLFRMIDMTETMGRLKQECSEKKDEETKSDGQRDQQSEKWKCIRTSRERKKVLVWERKASQVTLEGHYVG